MNAALSSRRLADATRERAVATVFIAAALVFGAVAALGSAQWLATAAVLGLIFVAAITLPMSWVASIIAALIPLQLYFDIPDSSLTLRAALVFVFSAALRVLVQRRAGKDLTRWKLWMLPAALFLLAAFAAALGASSRYLAFKGIYDWLAVFATAFVIGEAVRSRGLLDRLLVVLVAAGVGEALLGLAQYALGLDAVLRLLRLPVSDLFFQPNLLRDRLTDVSFNWVVFDRASPFGTFINGIDYALFLAAILGIALARLLAVRERKRILVLFASALLMGVALLLTFKGSGFLAVAGAAATVALFSLPRWTPRVAVVGAIVLIVAVALALPFAGLLAERVAFLVQREQGVTGTPGRLETWVELLRQLAQRPIFGYGLNHAPLLTEATRTLRYGAVAFNSPAAESAYVAALVETGIAGFAALMAWIGVVLARAIQLARVDTRFVGVLAALVALWLGNLTVAGFTTDQNGMLLGVLIGMVFSSVNLGA